MSEHFDINKTTEIIRKIVEDVFDVSSDTIFGESLIEKLEIFVSSSYVLRRNEITKYIEVFPDCKQMEQNDFNTIFIAAKKILQGIDYQLFDRLIHSDFIPTYNPLQDFFEGLGGTWKNPKLPPFPKSNNEFRSLSTSNNTTSMT